MSIVFITIAIRLCSGQCDREQRPTAVLVPTDFLPIFFRAFEATNENIAFLTFFTLNYTSKSNPHIKL